MSILFKFLKPYRTAAILALVMMLIELSVELSQPYLISKIIDNGIRRHDLSVVWTWGGFLVLSAIVAFSAGILSSFFASHASQGFGFDMRDRLYEKVQSFTYAAFNRFAASTLITRLTGDVSQLQDAVFTGLRFMSRIPLVVLGSVVMGLVVQWRLGLVLTVTVPVMIVLLILLMRRSSRMFRTVQNKLDSVNGVVQENLTGIRLIRVFVRMGYEVTRFAEYSRNLMRSTISALRLTETAMPFVLLLMNGGILVLLWFGRIEIAHGNATLGQTVAVINYTLRAVGGLSALSGIVAAFSRMRASALRVGEVLDAPGVEDTRRSERATSENGVNNADMENPPQPIRGAVSFEHVSFRYPDSDIAVLADISFKAEPGEVVAIMGATGSGKTSLVSLIARLYEQTEGVIRVDGRDTRELNLADLRGAIGYVPQEVLLFSGTVQDNIAWGNQKATPSEIEAAARAAQIHDTIMSLPDGYDALLGQRGVNLSGGQKQRLSIARALVRRPSILILDDSTSALDAVTEGRLLAELQELSCTTFIITQKIASTAAADLILLLDEGRLLAAGTHEQLLAGSGLYRSICESQGGKENLHVQNRA
ncbi:ABC transporter ATP-binding protein [Paenibacillus sp. HN-1]|uniref:ABC transporter ATP-binding protein n=1 Tax=Paenibacillus TaxID=44249 RepID=UPI001CA93AC7|nr:MULTISPECIES: ABC transporter ATP-binding protein [Paenibacillus]MBY9081532.1 ABC transporter ATP-binding protein [Paenibacillus sp. CGMCC 1.18879]MBY9087655.1 ABC transporter ATP-binding protein [Paenibacillus sinensis]